MREEPVWFSLAEALAIHEAQIARFGGSAGVRELGLLESALARPRDSRSDSDPAALAACYGSGIIKNHPFMDGNKRVGYVLCRVFLLRSGWDFTATQEEKYLMFYGVAAGQVSEEELAAWLRTRLIATESS